MRLCTKCYHITTGKPLYCNRCGSSYNVRLCRSQHVNPRAARNCSACGSKELSTPQPKVFFLLRPLMLLLGIGPGMFLLLAIVVYLGVYTYRLVTDPNGLLPLMCWGLLLCLLFFGWMMLPRWMQTLLKGAWRFVSNRKGDKEASHR